MNDTTNLFPTSEENAVTVVKDVKAKLGRKYKTAIRRAWETGDYGYDSLEEFAGDLQRIRNRLGPTWLVNFRG